MAGPQGGSGKLQLGDVLDDRDEARRTPFSGSRRDRDTDTTPDHASVGTKIAPFALEGLAGELDLGPLFSLTGTILRVNQVPRREIGKQFCSRIADHVAEDPIDPNIARDRHIEFGDACGGVLEDPQDFGLAFEQLGLSELARSLGVDQRHHVDEVAMHDGTERREIDRKHQQDGPEAPVHPGRFRHDGREPDHDLNQRQPRRAGIAGRDASGGPQNQEGGDELDGAVPPQDA